MAAFIRRCPLFFASRRRPFLFDYIDDCVDMGLLSVFEWPLKSLTTFDGEKHVGIAKELLWERLLFLLSLDGKVPLSNMCHGIRYNDDTVVCSNEYGKIMEFAFDTCHYFGDENSTGFATTETLDSAPHMCYDYIAFNSGGKHEIDYIHTDDDFVSEVWFYPSNRIDGNTAVRDACAVSKLTDAQMIEFDYSETMARFKVVHEMKQLGMKGVFAHDHTTTGKPKHYSFRTTSIRREVHRQQSRYSNPAPGVEIKEDSWQDMLEDLSPAALGYHRFLKPL